MPAKQIHKCMLTAICIILIVATILSLSIISEARLNLDLYGKNSVCFFLFGIKVIQIDILLERDESFYKLELKNKDKTLTTLSLNSIDRQTARDTLSQALPNPFYNLDIVDIKVDAEYGGDNAFGTAMISLVLENLCYGALLYILSTQRVKAEANVKPNFNSKAAILNLSGIFSITIADIIYGILFSKKGEEKK